MALLLRSGSPMNLPSPNHTVGLRPHLRRSSALASSQKPPFFLVFSSAPNLHTTAQECERVVGLTKFMV